MCNNNRAKWLLRLIKTESYGMLRYKSLRPSLSAKKRRNKLIINGLRRFFIEWLIKICATFQLEVQQTSLSR